MTLPTSGPLTLANIQTEFGGANPVSMSEYYAGGANVPSGTSGTNGAVPTSGQISVSKFYGTSDVTILDTQTVTTGNSGSAPNRVRGFSSGVTGSIVDGTSNIYGGATINGIYWDENAGAGAFYVLNISGATNTGWTTMTIGSKALDRASATTFASGVWTWNTADTVGTQAFGAASTVVTVNFT